MRADPRIRCAVSRSTSSTTGNGNTAPLGKRMVGDDAAELLLAHETVKRLERAQSDFFQLEVLVAVKRYLTHGQPLLL